MKEKDTSYQTRWKITLDYLFLRDRKLTRVLDLDPKKNQVRMAWQRLFPNIDLGETLANLMAKKIVKITRDGVVLEDHNNQSSDQRISLSFNDLALAQVMPLIWW